MTARRPLATPNEVAEFLKIPLKTLYNWRSKGTGPRASKVGVHLRYRWSDVDQWVEANTEAAAA